jgi:hypothetical protein
VAVSCPVIRTDSSSANLTIAATIMDTIPDKQMAVVVHGKGAAQS